MADRPGVRGVPAKPSAASIIRELDDALAATWPAADVEDLDGWLLRATGGVTRRSNSVLPRASTLGSFDLPLSDRLARAEEWYRKRDLPVRFQITAACEPAHLDEVLADRGYEGEPAGRAFVMSAPLPLRARRPRGTKPSAATVGDLSTGWLAVPGSEEREPIFRLISVAGGLTAGFALVTEAAAGLGVVASSTLAIYSMRTVPSARRQGHGSAILDALGSWAQSAGAVKAVLSVDTDNTAAIALYEQSGFETRYTYQYRTLRAAP